MEVAVLALVLALVLAPVEGGAHLDMPWFHWRGGVVPLTFQAMEAEDREVVRSTMALVEAHTCLTFQELATPPPGHRLTVRGASTSCIGATGVPTFSAVVAAGPAARGGDAYEVVLQTHNRLADSPQCVDKIRGGLLHELFHVLGIQHTQERPDRDRHIEVLKDNIKDRYKYSYDICHQCEDYGVPYDCSSIMHYGTETFSTGPGRHTMSTGEEDCDLRWVGAAFDGRHGPALASPSDWLLLERVADRLCRNTTTPGQEATATTATTTTTEGVATTTTTPRNKTLPKIIRKPVKIIIRPLNSQKDRKPKTASKSVAVKQTPTTTKRPKRFSTTSSTTEGVATKCTAPRNKSLPKIIRKPVKGIIRPLNSQKDRKRKIASKSVAMKQTPTRTTTTRRPKRFSQKPAALPSSPRIIRKPVKSVMRPLNSQRSRKKPRVVRKPVASIIRPISIKVNTVPRH